MAVNLLMLVAVTVGVILVGSAIGYVLFLKTRPKKETWDAKVYQLSQGARMVKTDKDGKIISKVNLNDLIPYSEDVLEKVEREPGITIFRLQRLNIVTPSITGKEVEFWGKGKRVVHVVVKEGVATLLTNGYDQDTGNRIFQPLPFSRTNMIVSQMAVRKDRLKPTKDILTAITPWIVSIVCMIGLISIAYIEIDGLIKISESLETASVSLNGMHQRVIDTQLSIERMKLGITPDPVELGGSPPPEIVEDG